MLNNTTCSQEQVVLPFLWGGSRCHDFFSSPKSGNKKQTKNTPQKNQKLGTKKQNQEKKITCLPNKSPKMVFIVFHPQQQKNIENEARQNLTPWVTWCLLVPCWGGYSMDEIVGRNCRFLVDPVSWQHQILTDKNRNDIVAMMGSLVMAYRNFVFLIFTVHLQLQIDANLIVSLLGNWFNV